MIMILILLSLDKTGSIQQDDAEEEVASEFI